MAIVLVTGGSSGIGLATVMRLAAAGDRVYAASRHPERAPAADMVIPMRLDVTDPAAADAAVASVVEDAGRLDVLVNNAGMAVVLPVEEAPDETMRAIFETNYFGPIRLARAAVPVMRAQGGGRIVNVTSMNDVFPLPFGAHYSASKAALANASVAFDAEVHGFGISVTVVAPGFFLTPMAQSIGDAVEVHQPTYQAVIDAMHASAPAWLASAGDPADVAAAIELCIRADNPPARVLVGADAEACRSWWTPARPTIWPRCCAPAWPASPPPDRSGWCSPSHATMDVTASARCNDPGSVDPPLVRAPERAGTEERGDACVASGAAGSRRS